MRVGLQFVLEFATPSLVCVEVPLVSHHQRLRLFHVLDQTGLGLELSQDGSFFVLQRLVQLFDISFDLHEDFPEAEMAHAHVLHLLGHLRTFHFILLLLLGLKVTIHHGSVYLVLQVEDIFVLQCFTHDVGSQGSVPLTED